MTKTEAQIVVGALLAAGGSRRFGSANKLLAAVDGEPLVRRSARSMLGAQIDHACVVTGYDQSAVQQALGGLAIDAVHNNNWAAGMGHSVGLAARYAIKHHATHLMICLGDMPLISTTDLDQLIAAARTRQTSVVFAAKAGVRGNPLILPRTLFDALIRLDGDRGARDIIKTCGLDQAGVDIAGNAHFDVDTPDDLSAFHD